MRWRGRVIDADVRGLFDALDPKILTPLLCEGHLQPARSEVIAWMATGRRGCLNERPFTHPQRRARRRTRSLVNGRGPVFRARDGDVRTQVREELSAAREGQTDNDQASADRLGRCQVVAEHSYRRDDTDQRY